MRCRGPGESYSVPGGTSLLNFDTGQVPSCELLQHGLLLQQVLFATSSGKARDHMQFLAPTQKLHANPTSPSPDNLHYLRTDKLGVSPDSRTSDASLCVSLTNLDTIRVQKGRSKRTGRTKNVAKFLPSFRIFFFA